MCSKQSWWHRKKLFKGPYSGGPLSMLRQDRCHRGGGREWDFQNRTAWVQAHVPACDLIQGLCLRFLPLQNRDSICLIGPSWGRVALQEHTKCWADGLTPSAWRRRVNIIIAVSRSLVWCRDLREGRRVHDRSWHLLSIRFVPDDLYTRSHQTPIRKLRSKYDYDSFYTIHYGRFIMIHCTDD